MLNNRDWRFSVITLVKFSGSNNSQKNIFGYDWENIICTQMYMFPI